MSPVVVEFPQVRARLAQDLNIHAGEIDMTAADLAARSILLVEDTTSLAVAYQSYLRGTGAKISVADTGTKCLDSLKSSVPDVLVLDLGLPDMNGLDILRSVRKDHPTVSVVVITNNASLGTDRRSHCGLVPSTMLSKPFNAERLNTTVRNALERTVLRKEVREIRKDISRETFHGFVGASKPMQAVYSHD